jgi:hypothetical protein
VDDAIYQRIVVNSEVLKDGKSCSGSVLSSILGVETIPGIADVSVLWIPQGGSSQMAMNGVSDLVEEIYDFIVKANLEGPWKVFFCCVL